MPARIVPNSPSARSVNLVVNIVAVMIVTGIITMVLLLQLLWILRSRMWLLLLSQL